MELFVLKSAAIRKDRQAEFILASKVNEVHTTKIT